MPSPRLDLDPSRPYQLVGDLLAIWLPRGRGRDDRAAGLLLRLEACTHTICNRLTHFHLVAHVVDDRLQWAKAGKRSLPTQWIDGGEDAVFPDPVALALDTESGRVGGGGPDHGPPEHLLPFFAAPLPAWLLDDLHARWLALFPPAPADWPSRAIAHWSPGELLTTLHADPTHRMDIFTIDGARFALDLGFCVRPGCACEDHRVIVQSVRDDATTRHLRDVADGTLDETRTIVTWRVHPGHESHVDRPTLDAVFAAWKARAVHPAKRFEELHERVKAGGRLLMEAWTKRENAQGRAGGVTAGLAAVEALLPREVAAVSGGVRPGRNDACPCGSGKKYKRCCGG